MAVTTDCAASEVSPNSGVSPPEKTCSTIAIVGGGLAGMTLAIGLLNQGVPFHIYESAPAFLQIGAGITCHPTVFEVLVRIDPRFSEGFLKCAMSFNRNQEMTGSGLSCRWGQDCRRNGVEGSKAGDLLFQNSNPRFDKDGNRVSGSTMHRAKFLDEMMKLLPDGFASFGKRLTDVVELDYGVKLSFADGTSAEHSAVIGCDGVKSALRQIMYPEVVPQFTGQYCYRGLIPMAVVNEILGENLAWNANLYCGYGGYIITYPVEDGKLVNVVAMMRSEEKEWRHKEWIVPSSKDVMLRDFDGWYPKLVDVLSKLENYSHWAIFDVNLKESYAKGKMCLIGDAAHASSPHLGAGAGMAFEDAFIMSSVLGALRDEKEVPAAFCAFDVARRERTRRIVLESRLQGLGNEFLKEGVMDDVTEFAKDLQRISEWIRNVDFDVMRREVLEKLKGFLQVGPLPKSWVAWP